MQWQAPSPEKSQGQRKGQSVSIGGATERGLPGDASSCSGLFLTPFCGARADSYSGRPVLPLQPRSPSVATDMHPEVSARLLPLCALPPERAPFWLAVPLQCPVLKDSLEGAPWLCPGSSERGRNPCGPGRRGWGRNPLRLETTTAPSLQRGPRRPLLRARRDPQSQCLPEAHRPARLPGAAILLLGKQWSKRRIRILFVHFSKVSFSFVPECGPLPARTHRYPLVPGSLDFFFLTLIL